MSSAGAHMPGGAAQPGFEVVDRLSSLRQVAVGAGGDNIIRRVVAEAVYSIDAVEPISLCRRHATVGARGVKQRPSLRVAKLPLQSSSGGAAPVPLEGANWV